MRLGIGLGLFKSGLISAGVRIFSAFQTRVINDGGTVEAGTCVVNAINSSALLQRASFLLIPSGYKGGKLYSEIPTNGNGDLTWTRGGTANRTNSSGNIELMASGVPRLSYMYGSCPAVLLEPQRTNSLRNSSMVGASTSPSTIPTNWVITLGGVTATVVGVGTENGFPYIDIRFNGTASATSVNVNFESTTQITASNGQTWTSSFWIKEVSASSPPLSYRNAITERDSAGATLAGSNQTITISSTLIRNAFTRTNTNASTARINNSLSMTLSVGSSYDYTVRIAAPQMELGAFSTTWINTTTAAATRVADTFSRDNIYTNGLITANGGTWFIELRGNVAYTRDATGNFWLGDNATSGSGGTVNSFTFRNNGGGSVRLAINKVIGGTLTALYTTTTDTTKIAIKWNGSTADVFANGTKVVSATSFTATNMEFLNGLAADAPKFIQAMGLWSTPQTDQFCQDITTL